MRMRAYGRVEREVQGGVEWGVGRYEVGAGVWHDIDMGGGAREGAENQVARGRAKFIAFMQFLCDTGM